jgi:hypothetical protein
MNYPTLIISLSLVFFLAEGHLTWAQSKRRQSQPRTQKRESQVAKSPNSPNNVPGYYWDKCGITNRVFLTEISREEALKRAYAIVTNYPKWYSYLPPCPLTAAEIRTHPLFTGFKMWVSRERDTAFTIDCFHPGADVCFRSKIDFPSETFETDPLANYHAQQCCYNKTGNLITSGPSAGTPDFVSSSLSDEVDKSLEGKGHIYYDVLPWTKLSINEYQVTWPSNQGPHKPFRTIVRAKGTTEVGGNLVFGENGLDIVPSITKRVWHPTHLRVMKGDVLQFKVIKGRVQIAEGIDCGPEGIKNLSKEQELILLPSRMVNPLTDPDSPIGSLIAAVYTGDYDVENLSINQELMTAPFYIGAEQQIEVLMNGYLMLTINDAMPDDNGGYFIVEIQHVN